MVSLVQALPAMRQSLSVALASLRAGNGDRRNAVRTERDLHPFVVVGGTVALWLALWLVPTFHFGLIEALLAVGVAFVFVVVSARMGGVIGTTSQPVSGMNLSALLVTSPILAGLGPTRPDG